MNVVANWRLLPITNMFGKAVGVETVKGVECRATPPLVERDTTTPDDVVAPRLRKSVPGVHTDKLARGRVIDAWSEGRYLDVLVRGEDSMWRIFHRLVVNDKRSSIPVPLQDLNGDQGTPDPRLTPRSDRDDPLYRGFGITELRLQRFETSDESCLTS